jgi:hypothetical protein
MNAREAVMKGQLVINGPVILIILLGCGASYRYFDRALANHNAQHVAVACAGFLLSIALAWLYWSVAVPRWREWALNSGADPEEIQRLAVRTGIVWPKGWVFEKTELPPRSRR